MSNYWEKASYNWLENSVRYHLSPSFRALKTFYYIQEAGHFFTGPSYFTERQNLLSYLILYTTNGEGMLTYEKQSFSVKAGDVFFIDCRKYQRYEPKPGTPWDFYFAHIAGSQVEGYFEEFYVNEKPVCSTEHTNIPSKLRFLVDLQSTPNVQTEIMNSKLIMDILSQLLLCKVNPNNLAIPEYISKIQTYMEKYYCDNINLDDLSATFNISKSHLMKGFNKFVGVSPINYLIQIRISRAKDLLVYSKLPISTIASMVGIHNDTHFINLFKRNTGVTPKKYRNTW